MNLRKAAGFFLGLGLLLAPLNQASAQMFVSTGSSSGLRLYYPSSNDWFLDPAQGRLDFRANGGTAFASFLASGYLGLGTAGPAAKLHMSSGTLLLDGNSAMTFKIGLSSLVFTNAGNLGLGTTTPASKIHLSSGSIIVDGDGPQPLLNLDTNAGSTAAGQQILFRYPIASQRNALGFDSNYDAWTFWDASPGLGTSAKLVAQITRGGSMLLSGQESYLDYRAPSARLHVSSSPSAGAASVLIDGNAAMAFRIGISSLSFTSAGYLGLSTTTPTSKHHVHDGDIRISTTAGAASRGIIFQDGTQQLTAASGSGESNTYTSSKTFTNNAFSVGGSTLVVAGGNVGIGTSAPAGKVHISSGQFLMDGTSATPIKIQSGTGVASFTFTSNNGLQLGVPGTGSVTDLRGFHSLIGEPDRGGIHYMRFFYGTNYQFGMRVNGDEVRTLQIYADVPADPTNGGRIAFYGGIGSEFMRLTQFGSLGIGTSNPTATLHVSSAASSATTPLLIVSSGAAAGQELLWLQANGSLGLGTTAPGSALNLRGSGASSYYGLMIQNKFADATDKGGLAIVGARKTNANVPYTALGTWDNGSTRFIYTGGGNWGNPGSNKIMFFTDPVYDENTSGGIMRMAIFPSGNIHIGPSLTPTATLHISSVGAVATDDVFKVSTGAAAANDILVIKGDGKVGIGTTAPASKLHVLDGDVRISTTVGAASRGIIFQDGTQQLTAASGSGESNTYTSSKTFTHNAFSVGASTLVIVGGNVGIGTTGPAARLHVSSGAFIVDGLGVSAYFKNNAAVSLTLESGSAASDSVIRHFDGTNSAYVGLQGGSGCGQGSWSVYNSGCRLNVKADGTIGIGTTNPTVKLDIVGGIFGSSTTAAENPYIRLPASNALYLSSVHTDSNRASPLLGFEGRNSGASQSTLMHHEGGSGGYWDIQQGGVVRLAVKYSNGFVEIGAGANPSEKLHVTGGNIKADYGLVAATGSFSSGITAASATINGDALFRANGFAATFSSGTAAGQDFGHITYGVGATNSMDVYGRPGKQLGLGANGAVFVNLAGTSMGIGTASPATKLEVNGDAQFGSNATKSTFSTTGALTLASGAALNASGAAGYIIGQSSITTTGSFFGDGSRLSGIPSTASISGSYVQKAGDAMTGPLTMQSNSTITISGNAFSVGGSTLVVRDGLVLIGTTSINGPISGNRTYGLQSIGKSGVENFTLAMAEGTHNNIESYVYSNTAGSNNVWSSFRRGGTIGAPTGVVDSMSLWNFRAVTSDGTADRVPAYFSAAMETGVNATSLPTRMSFATTPPGSISASVRMVITSTGNVGIGTTAPSAQLHVTQQLRIDGTDGGGYRAIGFGGNTVGTNPTVYSNGSYLSVNSATGQVLYLNSDSTGNVLIAGGGGKVGIGTASPGTTLDVSGNVQIGSGATKSTFTAVGDLSLASNAALTLSGATGNIATASSVTASAFFGSGAALLGIPSTASIAGVYVAKAGDAMTGPLTMQSLSTITISGTGFSVGGSTLVVRGGFVGIGNSAPAAALHIGAGSPSAASSGIQFGDTATDGIYRDGSYGGVKTGGHVQVGGNQLLVGVSDGALHLYQPGNISLGRNSTTGALEVKTLSTLAMVVNTSQRVGIGTTNPGARLEVSSTTASGVFNAIVSSVNTTYPGWDPGVGFDLTYVALSAYAPIGIKAEVSGNYGTGQRIKASAQGLQIDAAGTPSWNWYGGGAIVGSWINTSGQGLKVVGTPSYGLSSERISNTDITNSFIARRARGDIATPAYVNSGDLLGSLSFDAWSNANAAYYMLPDGYSSAAQIKSYATAASAENSVTGDLRFYTTKASITPLERMRVDADGNVGIGRTDPLATLHISSGASSVNTHLLRVSSGAADSQVLLNVQASGNVGIGAATAVSRLDVRGADVSGGLGGTPSLATMNLFSTSGVGADVGPSLQFSGENVGTSPYGFAAIRGAKEGAGNYAGYMTFHTVPVSSVQLERMRITSVGNVGIGTSGPTAELHVSSANAGASATPFLVSSGTGAGQELLIVKGDGRVGIGTTNLTQKLTVAGIVESIVGGFKFPDGTTQATSAGGAAAWSQNGGVIYPATATDNVVVKATLTVQGNAFSVGGATFAVRGGNVGIGTTNPNYSLVIASGQPTIWMRDIENNNGTMTLRMSENNDTDYKGGFVQYRGPDNTFVIGTHEAADLNTANDIVAIGIARATGYVGIGTTEPTGLMEIDDSTSTHLKLRIHTESATALTLAGIGFGINTSNNLMKSAIAHQRRGSNGQGDLVFLLDSDTTASDVVLTDEKMRIEYTGNVGIGTSDPDVLFQVGAGTFAVASTGNVGIGTTAPTSALEIAGTPPLLYLRDSSGNNNLYAPYLRFSESATGWQGGFIGYNGSNNRFHIGVHGNDNYTVADDTKSITMDRASGFVGVMNSGGQPAAAFQVGAGGNVGTADGTNILLGNYSSSYGSARLVGNWAGTGYWGIGPSDGSANETLRIGMVTNTTGTWSSTQGLSLIVGGSIGVGTMTVPGGMLEIMGNGTSENPEVRIINTEVDGRAWRVGEQIDDAPAGTFSIYDMYADEQRIFISSTGQVGIGTTNPKSAVNVEVSFASATLFLRDDTGNNGNTYLRFGENSTDWKGGFLKYMGSSNTFVMGVNDTAGFSHSADINSLSMDRVNGYVSVNTKLGIRTNSPSYNFHLAGGTLYWEEPGLADLKIAYDADVGNWASFRTDVGNGISFVGAPDVSVMVISRSSSNVGIGTQSPDTKLEIQEAPGPVVTLVRDDSTVFGGDSLGKLVFRAEDTSTNGKIDKVFIHAMAEAEFTGGNHRAGLYFGTAQADVVASTRMMINSDGLVGISTTSPTSKVHVHDGDIRISTTVGGTSRGIIFQDGTKQTTAGGGSNVVRSSGVSTQTDAADVWTSITGSTLTITTTGGEVDLTFNANSNSTVNGAGCEFRFLQDGVQLGGLACRNAHSSSGDYMTCPATAFTSGLSASTHNFVIQFRRFSSGTCSIQDTPWIFTARED